MHATEDRRWQGLLIAEAALAAAEGELGLIPAADADAIVDAADLAHIDPELVADQSRRTRHGLMPIIRALAAACDESAAGYVHWGATTQNIVQSADMLALRGFQRWLDARWAVLLEGLAALADDHRATLCAGRSHGQHAVPTTFGHVVAGWLHGAEELGRDLVDDGERALRAQLGGAVGTLASFGPRGPELMARFAAHLDLAPEALPDRSFHQGVERYGLTLGRLGSLAVHIATDLMLAMRSEQGELVEGFGAGVIGSSTMPQKVNPKDSQDTLHLGHRLAHAASALLTHPPAWEQGDRGIRNLVYAQLAECCTLATRLLPVLLRLFQGLQVQPEAMQRNLEAGGRWLLAERVMLALADRIGRQAAHERMHELATDAARLSLPEALRRQLGDAFDDAQITELCDPVGYIGAVDVLIDATLARSRATIGALRSVASRPVTCPDPRIQQRLRGHIAAIEDDCANDG